MPTKKSFVDVPALFRRQDKKARKWFAESVQYTNLRFMPQNEQSLKAYLRGDDDVVHLASYLSYLQHDHMVLFEHAAVNEGVMRWDLLAISVRYGVSSALVDATCADNHWYLAETLSMLLIAGWRQATELLLHAASAFVRWAKISPYGEQDFKFLVLLLADGLGQPLDRSRYDFTARDREEVPVAATAYEAVLADWRSTDLEVVQRLVRQMADCHVACSGTEHGPFDGQWEYLFPYEILAFLRLREWAGLANPTSFDHPLMNTALAVLPTEPLPWPEVPLLEEAIAKFKTEYPEHNYFDQLVVALSAERPGGCTMGIRQIIRWADMLPESVGSTSAPSPDDAYRARYNIRHRKFAEEIFMSSTRNKLQTLASIVLEEDAPRFQRLMDQLLDDPEGFERDGHAEQYDIDLEDDEDEEDYPLERVMLLLQGFAEEEGYMTDDPDPLQGFDLWMAARAHALGKGSMDLEFLDDWIEEHEGENVPDFVSGYFRMVGAHLRTLGLELISLNDFGDTLRFFIIRSEDLPRLPQFDDKEIGTLVVPWDAQYSGI